MQCIAGKVYLSSTPATDVYYNPKYEEVHHLGHYISATYGDSICRVPNQPEYGYQTLPPTNTHTPFFTIEDLLQDRLSLNQKVQISLPLLPQIFIAQTFKYTIYSFPILT